jgi:hypothetical protein
MSGARAASMPALRAPATPVFAWAMTRTGSPKLRAIAPVPSVDPSSTTTTSMPSAVWDSAEEMAAPTVLAALRAGMTTLTVGGKATAIGRRVRRAAGARW